MLRTVCGGASKQFARYSTSVSTGARRFVSSASSSPVPSASSFRTGMRWAAISIAGAGFGLVTAQMLDRRGDPVVHAASVPIGGYASGAGSSGTGELGDDGVCSIVFKCRDAGQVSSELQNDLRREAINQQGAAGATALMIAAYQGDADIVRVLLDHGADTEVLSSLVRSPTHWRSYFPNYQPLGRGFKAFDFAILGGHPDVIALLIERGKTDPSFPRQMPSGSKRGQLQQQQDENANMVSPETLVEKCHLVVNSGTFEAKEQQRRMLLAAVKRGRAMREDRLRRHRKQFPLESRLKEQLVGQDHAIQIVSSAVRRKENGWVDEESPLVMLFMGSSGIGKTRTAKEIGAYLHGGEDQDKAGNCFIRIDMSEFQHKHEVSKFIGAPPGYVGYEAGGQLVTKLEKCPNAVVLLDEVEKAHPDVLTVMLQAFDEGRLTDGQGKTVNCSDAIFILTSNLAQREIADEAVRLRRNAAASEAMVEDGKMSAVDSGVDPLTKNFKRNVVQPILRRHFGRDEFLGRINEITFFLPFTVDEQRHLARMELEAWQVRAAKKLNIDLSWSQDVEAIAAEEYDLRYGARSIKYEIDRMCIAPIARAQEQGLVAPGKKVHIDIDWEVIGQMREMAVMGDESRLKEQADKLRTALQGSVVPTLPAGLGGKGSADVKSDTAEAEKHREALVQAIERDQRRRMNLPADTGDGADGGDKASGDSSAILTRPPVPPVAIPGAKMVRSGKVAIHVMEKPPGHGAASGLKRFFGGG